MDLEDLKRFLALRLRLFLYLDEMVWRGDSGKVYEGTFEIIFPSYWHDRNVKTFSLIRSDQNSNVWGLKLHCYLLGPARHYQWFDSNLSCAIDKAKKDIEAWIAEDIAENEEESMCPCPKVTPRAAPADPDRVECHACGKETLPGTCSFCGGIALGEEYDRLRAQVSLALKYVGQLYRGEWATNKERDQIIDNAYAALSATSSPGSDGLSSAPEGEGKVAK